MSQTIAIPSLEEIDRVVSRAVRRELAALIEHSAIGKNSESLTPEQAANYLNQSVNTLRQWRSQGRGPAYEKRGRSVYYKRTDLDAWSNANRVFTGEALESLSRTRLSGSRLRAAGVSHA